MGMIGGRMMADERPIKLSAFKDEKSIQRTKEAMKVFLAILVIVVGWMWSAKTASRL